MPRLGKFFQKGRVGWAALVVLLGAALPSARAEVITGTDSNGSQVSILIDFFQGAHAAPLDLTNSGGTVTLSLPDTGPNTYHILFGMKAGNNALDIQGVLNDPNVDPPDGPFTYTPTIGGKTYTVSGALNTSNSIDPNSWDGFVIPSGVPGFSQAGLLTFKTTGGDPTLTLSVSDPNGNVIDFADPNAPKAPEPASLALAGMGLVGLAGYGWRRRRVA